MLAKFSVTNFKSFNQEFVFDLSQANGYAFNEGSVEKGIIENAIVYGKNGVGKSNLGLAVFDIVGHLTDKEHAASLYKFYLNAQNKSKHAVFKYEFLIRDRRVSYEYKKNEQQIPVFEKFCIDDNTLAYIDRKKGDKATINFVGTESLNTEISNESLSLLKYIKRNSVLDKDNIENLVFLDFYRYIESMLFFRSLDMNLYLGLETGTRNIQEDIIEKNNVADLNRFLKEAGVECKLKVEKKSEGKILVFDFDGKSIPFYEIASHGTKALTLFYFWLQRLREEKQVSLVFIDEFDAFYHHELSRLIVEELKKVGVPFILTTHNTSIMSNEILRPDCYFIMKNDSIKPLSKTTMKELREAHNLEKMYKAGVFNG